MDADKPQRNRCSEPLPRRRFVQQGVGAAAAAVTFSNAPHVFAADDTPAILGGRPVRSGGWPSWPVSGNGEDQGLTEVLRSGGWNRFTAKESRVAAFEQQWAKATAAVHCQATSSGTAALITSLAALDVGPGDEVLLSPYTFIATVNSVLLHHALPVFVDSDPATAQMNVAQIESRICENTRCLIPVHLGGASCDMDRLLEIADRRGLRVVEDACQSHTGEWNGKRLGTLGDAGCFSFQNSKNLTSGEGGAMVTRSEEVYHRAEAFHNNGNGHFAHDGRSTSHGGNFRMTEFQGALLLQQLARLEEQSRRRQANAAYLDQLLGEIEGVAPKQKLPGTTRHGYHLYIFDFDPQAFAGMSKSRFRSALGAEGIPVSGGYAATNKLPWVESFLQSRGFQRIYGKKRLDRWREENQLPANDRMIETTCWMPQNMLLGERQDMELIAAAMNRVRKHAGAILDSEPAG